MDKPQPDYYKVNHAETDSDNFVDDSNMNLFLQNHMYLTLARDKYG